MEPARPPVNVLQHAADVDAEPDDVRGRLATLSGEGLQALQLSARQAEVEGVVAALVEGFAFAAGVVSGRNERSVRGRSDGRHRPRFTSKGLIAVVQSYCRKWSVSDTPLGRFRGLKGISTKSRRNAFHAAITAVFRFARLMGEPGGFALKVRCSTS